MMASCPQASIISGMGRGMPISSDMPKGVEVVRVTKSGKTYTYFYWNPGRGTARQGDRVRLPDAGKHPAEFWREVERLQKDSAGAAFPPFSVGALVDAFSA